MTYSPNWRDLCLLVSLVVFVWPAQPTRALTINPTFIDSDTQTWDATRRGVVNQAIRDWSAVIDEDRTVNVKFNFTHGGIDSNDFLGRWQGNFAGVATGSDIRPWTPGVSQIIHFNSDHIGPGAPNRIRFDSTPDDVNIKQDSNEVDALSIARHELGHLLGFASNFYLNDFNTDDQSSPWDQLINKDHVFDPANLDIQLNSDDEHTAIGTPEKGNSLLDSSLRGGVREFVQPYNLQQLAVAYDYNVAPTPVPEPATLGFMAVGGLLAFGRRRRRRRAA